MAVGKLRQINQNHSGRNVWELHQITNEGDPIETAIDSNDTSNLGSSHKDKTVALKENGNSQNSVVSHRNNSFEGHLEPVLLQNLENHVSTAAIETSIDAPAESHLQADHKRELAAKIIVPEDFKIIPNSTPQSVRIKIVPEH